jgi:hypothetical protein
MACLYKKCRANVVPIRLRGRKRTTVNWLQIWAQWQVYKDMVGFMLVIVIFVVCFVIIPVCRYIEKLIESKRRGNNA